MNNQLETPWAVVSPDGQLKRLNDSDYLNYLIQNRERVRLLHNSPDMRFHIWDLKQLLISESLTVWQKQIAIAELSFFKRIQMYTPIQEYINQLSQSEISD